MGDDGVGILVAQELTRKIHDTNIDILEVNTDGLNLLEFVPRHDKLIVIDAILVQGPQLGKISRLEPKDFDVIKPTSVLPHQFNLISTLDMGNKLFPGEMPQDVIVFTIGIQEVTIFTEELSPDVARAIPRVVKLVLEELAIA